MTTPKKRPISLKALRKQLTKTMFDPREPGPMKIIADVGNIQYYVMRGIEFSHMANQAVTSDDAAVHLRNAMRCMLLALVIEDQDAP